MDLIGEFLTTSTTNSSNRSQTNNTVITNLNGKSVSYVTMITDDSYFPGVQALIKVYIYIYILLT